MAGCKEGEPHPGRCDRCHAGAGRVCAPVAPAATRATACARRPTLVRCPSPRPTRARRSAPTPPAAGHRDRCAGAGAGRARPAQVLRRPGGGPGLSLTAAPGAVTAVLGPNGAGKTTTIECCEGLRRPDGGTVEVLGVDRSARRADAALRARVGVMLQDGGLPLAPRAGAVLAHVARLHADPGDPAALLARLGLEEVARTAVRRLSGGQRQRLALAAAVVGRPEPGLPRRAVRRAGPAGPPGRVGPAARYGPAAPRSC